MRATRRSLSHRREGFFTAILDNPAPGPRLAPVQVSAVTVNADIITTSPEPEPAGPETEFMREFGISEGGVDTAVGRAPRGDAVTVDGVPVPDPTAPARGGGAR